MKKEKFASLKLQQALIDNLATLEYHQMTAIQAASLPAILDGRDVIAQAKTGSGKTAAFALGMLEQLNPRWFAVQGLVLCPTRELADQVAQEIRRLARGIDNIKVVTLCGGTPMGPQIASLEHGAHIIVGTPGRLQDHLSRGTLQLAGISMLVLDEADRMVDMGFIEEIVGIIRACPRRRQTVMFSATYPDNIRELARQFMREPLEVRVESLHDAGKIEQWFYKVTPEDKFDTVARILQHVRPQSAVAFCNTKEQCKTLVEALQDAGFSAIALYGDLEQRDRDQVLVRFASKSATVLVATDVAARGLDIKDLDLVINVDVAHDPEVHIHRIGRTGRVDNVGIAMTLAVARDEKRLGMIEAYQGSPLPWDDASKLKPAPGGPLLPPMCMVEIAGGKRDKLRPGDILGALTVECGLEKQQVGKISVSEMRTYVALDRDIIDWAFERFSQCRIKAKQFKMRRI